ncbi:hypothetical protein E6W39_17460 [Kitasatospora acidiphila]|uniref:Uncharacterized protein n=1 Tax=Kitasatospora acidiphila TaxID=2567942 RepID=A0A540W3T0_9ACTN|nr:hypothetical protein [Kitasatospora acidiphila]TQF03690.1 hypothetical protein E6W39_17460 [Kitasatospora acidiphila]
MTPSTSWTSTAVGSSPPGADCRSRPWPRALPAGTAAPRLATGAAGGVGAAVRQLAERAVAEGAAGVGEGLVLGAAEVLGPAVGVALGVPVSPAGQLGWAVGLAVAVAVA